jgi:hypothetical protein
MKAKLYRLALVAGPAATLSLAARADNPMTEIFAAVDLSTVATFVGATGVLIIGIAMAFKGIGLSKRAVKMA